MSKKVNKTEILEPGKYYHILNRAVGNELLFKDEVDYAYFFVTIYEVLPSVIKLYPSKVVHNSEKTLRSFFLAVETKLSILA